MVWQSEGVWVKQECWRWDIKNMKHFQWPAGCPHLSCKGLANWACLEFFFPWLSPLSSCDPNFCSLELGYLWLIRLQMWPFSVFPLLLRWTQGPTVASTTARVWPDPQSLSISSCKGLTSRATVPDHTGQGWHMTDMRSKSQFWAFGELAGRAACFSGCAKMNTQSCKGWAHLRGCC